MSLPSKLILAAVVAIGLSACTERPANGPGRAANNNVPRVVTAAAHVEQMGVEIEAVGTAQAKESIQVTSKVSNTVTGIHFKEGEEVAEGTVLVEMHDTESRAAVAEAEAALARTRSQFDRTRDLRSRQALSAADFEQVEATLKADEARLDAVKSRLSDTVLRAPFRGTTGFRSISVGGYVSPGTVITTLDDTSTIKLDFTVPETLLFIVRRGLPIAARATGLPERVFTGTVTNIDSRVDPVTRSIAVRAELPNSDRALRQGMFLTVALKGELAPTLLVPEEAIVPERGKAYVFVVQDNVVQRREVRTGKRKPGSVEIIEGVREHEHVVVEGTQNIRDGSTVQEMPPPNSPS